jgi:hypothetical protein
LIKAVMKSNIIVLTFTSSKKTCRIVKEKLYEKITTFQFIKQCITECIKIFFDHPLLFYHKFPNNELKDNQKIIYYLIKICIKNAIYACIPMKEVLYEYLNNDYKEPEKPDIKKMIYHDIYDNDEGDIRKILESDNDNLDSLIFDRRKDVTSNILEDDEFKQYVVKDDEIDIADEQHDKFKMDEIKDVVVEDIKENKSDFKMDNVKDDKSDFKMDKSKDEKIDEIKYDNLDGVNDDKKVELDETIPKQTEYMKEIAKLRNNNINIIKQSNNDDKQNHFGELYE